MDLRTMQTTIDNWIQKNGGYWDEMSLLARLSEEVGELAREYNHRFGAKKKKASEGEQELADELADVLWIVMCMANQQEIDLQDAFARTMNKLLVRDAERFGQR
jgi:NTP pyrophosphatase (non-canonical NTP hydrolase)